MIAGNATGTIYGLVDPRSGIIRYVGQTGNTVSQRLSEHVGCAKAGDRTYRSNWIRRLLALGHEPFAVVLERTGLDRLSDAEIRWIAKMRSVSGRALTNATTGGDRPTMSNKTRAKMSASHRAMSDATRERHRIASTGRRASDETRRRLSEANRGHATPDDVREKLRAHMTDERKARMVERLRAEDTRAKISAAVKARWKNATPEQRAAWSLRNTRKHTTETLEKLRRKVVTEETRRRMSAAQQLRQQREHGL